MLPIYKRIFIGALLTLSVLFLIFVYRAFVIIKPCQHNIKGLDESKKIKLTQHSLNILQQTLQFKTVSSSLNDENLDEKLQFVKFIRKEYEEIEKYSFVKCIPINTYSLLYKIEGNQINLRPYLLAAHYDVVPADVVNDNWTHHPFSGHIDGEYLYGRGSMDDKTSMIGHLEALRYFLKENGQPKRTIYLAYGHDEEITGLGGGQQIANYLENVTLEFVLDEGSMIIDNIFPDVKRPIALISVAEKGYLTVKFSINVTAGHSSMPNKDDSALFILSEAIHKLKQNQIPSLLGRGPEKEFLEKLAVHFGFLRRIFLTNIWFFKPIIEYIFSKSVSMDAFQRTTTAVTLFKGGYKDNVMPSYAEFVVNHRIHSIQTCQEILNFDLKTINNPRINYEILDCMEPSGVSPINVIGYKLIEHTTMQIYPDSIIVPTIVLGITDSRFYSNLTKNIYRYLPYRIKETDLKRYHGVNERITIKNYENLINFYLNLFRNTDNAHLIQEKLLNSEL